MWPSSFQQFPPMQTGDGGALSVRCSNRATMFYALKLSPDSFMIGDSLLIRKFHTLIFFVKEVCSVYVTEENNNGYLTTNL